jgi:hypothetical protein
LVLAPGRKSSRSSLHRVLDWQQASEAAEGILKHQIQSATRTEN